ncbi:hypothetical protein HJG60_011145 [Phyllostomus discolor]|uniref:Uncharacterized protein n=1 Tax=Phyllostomus discolor TaxID=89673 RepID=A0A834E509_9CHIR|nr:hypothetical protein HJG60_011145 [Phyllostomus discolor]
MSCTSLSSVTRTWPTQRLLHLELAVDLTSASATVFPRWVTRRGTTSLTQARAWDSWDLHDQRLRNQKGFILLGQLLVLVEFLQRLDVHVGDIHSLGLIAVLLVPWTHTENLGWGVDLLLAVPEKRLSFWGLSFSKLVCSSTLSRNFRACAGSRAGLPASPCRECRGRLRCS